MEAFIERRYKMHLGSLSRKGQITIPADIREALKVFKEV